MRDAAGGHGGAAWRSDVEVVVLVEPLGDCTDSEAADCTKGAHAQPNEHIGADEQQTRAVQQRRIASVERRERLIPRDVGARFLHRRHMHAGHENMIEARGMRKGAGARTQERRRRSTHSPPDVEIALDPPESSKHA